jgi:hypothetical protein
VVMAGVNGFNAIEGRARLGGGLRRENQGGRITASTQRLRGTELGGRAVGGGQIQQRCGRTEAMWEEGDDMWGQPVS